MNKDEDYIGVTISFLCHDGKGNFVMAKRGAKARDENGRWDNGGGALEFGESVKHRLKSEIKEEYCADVLGHEFLGFREAHRIHDGKPTHWISLDFMVLVNHDQVKNGEPHKFDDLGWFTVDTLPSPLHSQFSEFFQKCKNKLQ